MQCIVVKSDEFENSLSLYIFPLNPDYVAARSLRSLRSNNFRAITRLETLATQATTYPIILEWSFSYKKN